ncbi:MAG: hypothetical protein NC318_07325 [Blautia sp.]|nr:hypothetical protein [Lachnoclostridium sp.]MCM1211398.1 hypothetical protein [Blautia sp.]
MGTFLKKIEMWTTGIIRNKIALVIALVQFVLSFWTDKLIFNYVTGDFSEGVLYAIKYMKRTIAAKAVFLVLVILLWQGIFYFFTKTDKGFRYRTLFYFGVMFLLLLLTWPGIWRLDEFGILTSSMQLMPYYWHSYITSVWYIFSMMLLPFPAGIIIVQIAVAALVYARFVSNCLWEYDLHTDSKGGSRRFLFSVIVSVPFFFFPVLDSNLYPLRMSMYAFLELLLLSELYILYRKQKSAERNQSPDCVQNNGRWVSALAFLAAVVGVWRSEAVYYLVWFPMILCCIGGVRRYWKQIVLYIAMFAVLFMPQQIGNKKSSGDGYSLMSTIPSVIPLVLEAQKNGEEALLEPIDRIIDTEIIARAAAEGKNVRMEGGLQKDHATEDFPDYTKAYYKLILKYPTVFLKERFQNFLASTQLIGNTTKLFAYEEVDYNYNNYVRFRTYPLCKPISDKMRTFIINILEVRKLTDNTEKYWATDWIYSPLPAVMILIIVFAALLIRRKWTLAVIVSAALVRVPLVFLTAPSYLFMYYYSVYLIGFVVLFYMIAKYVFLPKQRQ